MTTQLVINKSHTQDQQLMREHTFNRDANKGGPFSFHPFSGDSFALSTTIFCLINYILCRSFHCAVSLKPASSSGYLYFTKISTENTSSLLSDQR